MKHFSVDQQGKGQFNFGQILENKPIPFPHEPGGLRGFSNIVYWAHAWSDKGSTIGEHPHQAFEILSFVVKGTIDHYDNKNKKWFPLKNGDAQIIRAGNGITHAERINEKSAMFQIWFDPNLNESIKNEASYSDYRHEDFTIVQHKGYQQKIYAGKDGLIDMKSYGVEISAFNISENTVIELHPDKAHCIYALEGDFTINGVKFKNEDFGLEEEQSTLQVETNGGRLFVISVVKKVPYATYIS